MKRVKIAIVFIFISGALPVICFAVLCISNGDDAIIRFVFRPMTDSEAQPYLMTAASPIMSDRNGALLYAFLAEDEQWRFPVCLDKISPLLVQATIATEDKRFYHHAGVDVRAVLRAAWLNLKSGRLVSGASTLTMQLVKQQFPTPRTLAGKFSQAAMAARLDNAVGKDALLEAYLNTAPYGGNLVGVEAAARRYFGKSCAELTLAEAATLAGLPKSPVMLDPLRHPEAALRRRNYVLRRMRRERMISAEAYEQALAHPLGAVWHEYPSNAPHIAMALREKIAQQPGGLRLTLDGALQMRLETLLPHYLKQFDNRITNGALIVVDARCGEVLARVGSADFNNARIAGQVDVCRASRAPGSALKPFVYALALERQQLYPTEALLDNTLDYGEYNPGNFDGTFSGMVSATEALRWSLNVPAVQAQQRAGIAETVDFLKALGFDTLHRSADAYGLGLVLGNCEIRLESLVAAYLALARLGEYTPLRLHADAPETAPVRVLSEGIALAVWDMLEQPFPEEPWKNLVRIGDRTTRVCWKTGTSTGYHDAWAVAFNRHYVVGAWLGNSDGRSSDALVGAYAALPLVARVFRSLPVPSEPDWPHQGDLLVENNVCAITGLPASKWCPTVVSVGLPREQLLHRRCDVHRPGSAGNVVAWWPGSPYNWDLARVPAARPVSHPAATGALAPPDESESRREQAGIQQKKALEIIAPANNATYVLTGNPQGDLIRLNASLKSASLHWYHNDRYLGRSVPLVPLYITLTPGQHRVACMDESGQTAAIAFTVTAG